MVINISDSFLLPKQTKKLIEILRNIARIFVNSSFEIVRLWIWVEVLDT